MEMEQVWEQHKEVLVDRLEKLGIRDIGYAFDLFDDESGYYYSLLLSGGGPSSSIVFRVNEENMFLDKIEYEVVDVPGGLELLDITQDLFANELWDRFDEIGVIDEKWEERY